MVNLSQNLEDYLEVIGRLTESEAQVTISAIAREMGVSRPSVTQIVAKMMELGLVEHMPYGDVKLTAPGIIIASKVEKRHRLLSGFLTNILGVPPEIAEKEACMLEHSIGPETTAALTAFIAFVEASSSRPEWLTDFREFMKKGELAEFSTSGEIALQKKKKRDDKAKR